jgi:serine/threonine-protein kinase HipA
VAQPIQPQQLTPAPTAAIVEGWLPEGDALNVLSAEFGNAPQLLAALGRETIGAVLVVPAGEDPPPFDPKQKIVPLSESEIADRLRNLPTAPLGVSSGTDVRLSLAGAQAKLPLASSGGKLSDPTTANPSTVILKPEPAEWPDLVELEAWGLSVMQTAGVLTADWRIDSFDGITTLVVERYDRDLTADPEHRRVHQEDLCMAVGARPRDKYAKSPRSATSLTNLASVVYQNSATPSKDLQTFITALVVNVAIGNADAHSRNLSLIHLVDGTVTLAPAYDVIPTYHYPLLGRHLAQPINQDVFRPETVNWDHLAAEVNSWGIPNTETALAAAVDDVGYALDQVPAPLESPALESLLGDYQRFTRSQERTRTPRRARHRDQGLDIG